MCIKSNMDQLLNTMLIVAGEPIFGVYPPYGGREPSFPNPTANLVSTKKEHILPFKGEALFHARGRDFSAVERRVFLLVVLLC